MWLPFSSDLRLRICQSLLLGTNILARLIGHPWGQGIWSVASSEWLLSTTSSYFTCTSDTNLVSHYSATGDTISCDARYSATGSEASFFLRSSPPSKACLWIAIGHFYGMKWGCSSDSLRYHRKHSATWVLYFLHLSRDRGEVPFRPKLFHYIALVFRVNIPDYVIILYIAELVSY